MLYPGRSPTLAMRAPTGQCSPWKRFLRSHFIRFHEERSGAIYPDLELDVSGSFVPFDLYPAGGRGHYVGDRSRGGNNLDEDLESSFQDGRVYGSCAVAIPILGQRTQLFELAERAAKPGGLRPRDILCRLGLRPFLDHFLCHVPLTIQNPFLTALVGHPIIATPTPRTGWTRTSGSIGQKRRLRLGPWGREALVILGGADSSLPVLGGSRRGLPASSGRPPCARDPER